MVPWSTEPVIFCHKSNITGGVDAPWSEIGLVGLGTTDRVQTGVRPLKCRDTWRRAFMEIREPAPYHLRGLLTASLLFRVVRFNLVIRVP